MRATCVWLLSFCLVLQGVHSSFSNEIIQEWMQGRCGDGSAVWAYEGTLYDPLDGRKICQVEGLELVRTLAGPNDDNDVDTNRLSDLVSKDLKGNSTTTVLSRKLFCYKSPPKGLLSSIKLRHNSPNRPIPTNQAVAVYDTATTISSRQNGKQLVLHTEFPNGKCYWASAESSSDEEEAEAASSKSLDFTVYTKKRSTDLPELQDEQQLSQNGDVVVAPRRSKLIQFGASSKQDVGRFGARETYSYTLTKNNKPPTRGGWKFWSSSNKPSIPSPPSCSVKYTRYGEGPPWYSPGKYCTLELKGRRVDGSLKGIAPLASKLATQIPGFLSVDGRRRIESEEQAKEAVTWFRQQGLVQLDDNNQSVEDQMKARAMKAWNKLRGASSHVTEKNATS